MTETSKLPGHTRTGLSEPAQGARALIVDDNEALLVICVRTLAGQGYRVEAAQDAESALRALRRTSFDVVVSDIQMPGMSGLELVEQMRAEGLDIPVVLVTGSPDLASAIAAMKYGVLRYLEKPIEARALVGVVNDVVRLQGIARVERLALDNDALRSLVEELRRSKDAALAGTRAKTEFLSKMGHELRAPMSAVIGMTDLALGTELTRAGREYLEVAKASADALMETIAHVLDFSALDGGHLQLEANPFKIRDVIELTLKQLWPIADVKGLSLLSEVGSSVPEFLVGDAVRFGLILKALVSNAIKFTNEGEVRLSSQLEAHSGSEVRVCVSISDTGVGIQKEALQHVVEAFSQQDDSPTRRYGGAGLGLTIASQLVFLMKGSLTIDSTPSVGTTLRFTVCFERMPIDDDFFLMDAHARRSPS